MYLDRVHFDVEQRRREKQQDRDRDSARLLKSDGEAAKLSQQNGMFSAFKPAQMSIAQRRVRMQLA